MREVVERLVAGQGVGGMREWAEAGDWTGSGSN